MEKTIRAVYKLGTGKILYYVEKVSGEKYCPIGETTLYIQDGYEFRDETNNVINAKRITLVRKQPQYLKSYKECCKVLGIRSDWHPTLELDTPAMHDLTVTKEFDYVVKLESLCKLLICRDAYWKIAGEQMGLGKPWEPDWNEETDKFTISNKCNKIYFNNTAWYSEVLAFPTEEMRDAFFENFKDLIEQCKELL